MTYWSSRCFEGILITPDQALHHPQKISLRQCLGPVRQPTPTGQACLQRRRDFQYDGLSNLSQEELIVQLTGVLSRFRQQRKALSSSCCPPGRAHNITVLPTPRSQKPYLCFA